jgi:hypothetical protein
MILRPNDNAILEGEGGVYYAGAGAKFCQKHPHRNVRGTNKFFVDGFFRPEAVPKSSSHLDSTTMECWNLNARLPVLAYLTPASPENISVILRRADESADTGFVLTPPPHRSHNPGVAYHRRYS